MTVYALRIQVNLDGYALPIKKLKGTESVESLDLSNKRLGVASAIVIASLIGVNNALTALDFSFNDLKDEGVSAVCEAIKRNKETKLASLNVKKNGIGPMGANAVAAMAAVTGALTSVDLSRNRLTEYYRDMTGIKELAAALGVNGALTHLSLVGNEKLGDEGVEALSVAIEQSKSLRTLDLSSDSECQPCSTRVSTMFGPKGATALAKALAINSSLTQIEYAGSMNAALWAPSYNVCFLVFVPAGCRATTLESRVPRRSRTPCTSTARSGRYVSLSAHTRLTPLS